MTQGLSATARCRFLGGIAVSAATLGASDPWQRRPAMATFLATTPRLSTGVSC